MTEVPPGLPRSTPPGGQVSDRMQALLSRAVEEQVSEQRSVSLVLAELRSQVAGLAETLRLTASDAAVERLGGVVSHVVADLRTSTSLLGQRIEALSKRLETVAAEAVTPNEQAVVRLSALAADVGAQREAVDQMREAVQHLGAFPAALAALQRDVAGMHDRLQPLADLRSHVADLGATSGGSADALRPRLDALEAKIDLLAQGNVAERTRDLVVDAVSARLDRLEEAATRPIIGPEVLKGALGDLRSALAAATGERLEELTAGLSAVENRLGQVGQRVADIGDAAGAVPALATDMGRLGSRLNELSGLRDDLATVAEGVRALQAERPGEAMDAALLSVRQDLGQLSAQVAATPPPSSQDVATLVSQRVADRLVEVLAPRIADVVLTRVSGALVTQLGEALSPRLQAETEQTVRQATSESERRILTHLDEAVLALAEALLRRRPTTRAATTAAPVGGKTAKKAVRQPEAASTPAPEPAEDVQQIMDRLNTVGSDEGAEAAAAADPRRAGTPDAASARAAVTTGLAPARSTDTEPASPPAAAPAKEPVAAPVGKPVSATAGPSPRAAKSVSKAAQARSAAARAAGSKSAPRAAAQAPVGKPDNLTPAVRKGTARKAVKAPARPILDRTPDLSDDDNEPVQSAPRSGPQARPIGRPATAARPGAGSTTSPRPQIDRPIMPPAPRPQPPAPREPPSGQGQSTDSPQGKRKPWWRPGG